MPSKGEGFGFVFIEALACGKPVIAGNSDGSRDALLDGELGILVNPENTKEITESIIKVLKKETSNKLLDGQYLRKRVLKVYGFDKFKERAKNLLYELSR
jgi:glycosyltransferase involved in cell wall biosynthesis